MSTPLPTPTDWLSKILSYVDSPFKLIAIVIMGILTFTGYLILQHHETLLGAYREQQKLPDIAENRIDETVALLFKNTQAEIVTIWKVNPILGTRMLYRAYTRDGRDKSKEGIDVGLFTQNTSNNKDVIALMAGEIPCGEYLSAQSEIGLWYIEKGMRYGCRISIPPDKTRFIGQITVGWKSQPENLKTMQDILTIAAIMLTKEKK